MKPHSLMALARLAAQSGGLLVVHSRPGAGVDPRIITSAEIVGSLQPLPPIPGTVSSPGIAGARTTIMQPEKTR